ncbi:glutamine synthetase [Puteibacter caeruleilacunae]|nr:glutamine synthetase [Puteibacter caeruleilacunae]
MAEIHFNPNSIERYLQKKSSDFTCDDIVRYIEEKEIELVNFRYVAEDGKLKTINFVVTGHDELLKLLTQGTRVDGSLVFSYIEPHESDIFLIPRYKTAFQNPFSDIPAIDILCSFHNAKGRPMESAPENILRKAMGLFKSEWGCDLKASWELEYYVATHRSKKYPTPKNGYHSGEPFTGSERLRNEALQIIARCGGMIRMGHSEMGSFKKNKMSYEQHEIRFSSVDADVAADQLIIAKWILRMLGKKYNLELTFIPKIALGEAGNGLHVHFHIEKDGVNLLSQEGKLNDVTRKMVYGLLKLAPSVTAFANTVPVSYLRLRQGEEVPLHACWGKGNRSALVRIPMGWRQRTEELEDETTEINYEAVFSSIEYRGGDASAQPYLFLAAIIMAAHYGLKEEESLEKAPLLHTTENMFDDANAEERSRFERLPTCCRDAAQRLDEQRVYFEDTNVFPDWYITHVVKTLSEFNSEREEGNDQYIEELINEYLHLM